MIHHLPEIDWEVEIYYIYREANRCADALANIGGDRGIHWSLYENCPVQLSHLIFVEVIVVFTPWLVNFSIVFDS
jgi:hypothetical protein